jgi:hypothetical protein
MAELLCRAVTVAVVTEAADVGVFVRAAVGERDDVVGDCRCPDAALGGAVAAEGFGLKAALALLDSSTTAEAW